MMSAALDFDQLPASTLELLLSMLTADPGAGTARKWADDVLALGVSSDALVDLALLGDHEWERAAALLPQALQDAGLAVEPRGALLRLLHRLLIRAWFDGRLGTGEFELILSGRFADDAGTEELDEDERRALSDLGFKLAFHLAHRAGAEGCPGVGEDEVAAAARTAFARLSD